MYSCLLAIANPGSACCCCRSCCCCCSGFWCVGQRHHGKIIINTKYILEKCYKPKAICLRIIIVSLVDLLVPARKNGTLFYRLLADDFGIAMPFNDLGVVRPHKQHFLEEIHNQLHYSRFDKKKLLHVQYFVIRILTSDFSSTGSFIG